VSREGKMVVKRTEGKMGGRRLKATALSGGNRDRASAGKQSLAGGEGVLLACLEWVWGACPMDVDLTQSRRSLRRTVPGGSRPHTC
jgi:hypothetical protein